MAVLGRTPTRRIEVGSPPPSIVARTLVEDPHVVLRCQPQSPLSERYRRLRHNLERGWNGHGASPQVTVITSAVPGEGKTTTAVNLALAFGEDRKHRTLLVDADLRRPSVSRYVVPPPTFGLAEVLSGEIPLDRALIEMSDSRLCVLPAGAPTPTPLDLLQDDPLGRLFAELRLRFDRIVIDTPPTLPFTDAAALAAHADGTLLVVRAGATTSPLVRRAKESLCGANLLGAVLNDVEFTVVDQYYYGFDDCEPERYTHPRQEERAARADHR